MFVKLLVLLFYNVFVSFSVLVCSRSLTEKCGLRVEISKGVPVSAIECTEPAIEHMELAILCNT